MYVILQHLVHHLVRLGLELKAETWRQEGLQRPRRRAAYRPTLPASLKHPDTLNQGTMRGKLGSPRQSVPQASLVVAFN